LKNVIFISVRGKTSRKERSMRCFKQSSKVLSLFLFLFSFFYIFTFQKGTADVSNMRLNTDFTTELQNEEMIWVSPVDSNIVMAVWRDFRLGFRKVAIGVSTDGGYTWVDSLLTGGVYIRYSDPAIWCDRFGNFYPLAMNFSWTFYGECNLALWKTTDNGTSWLGPWYAVHDTVNEFAEDKEFMTIDRTGGSYDGNIYICWARFPSPTRIMFVRSTDGGVNWSDTLVVGSPDEVEGYSSGQFSFPLVDAYGNVYVVWRGYVKINETWYGCQRMVKSTDGGQSFTYPSEVIMVNNDVWEAPGGINIYNMCAMDADITTGPYRGNIYLAVPDGTTEEPNSPSDIILVKSTDGGDTWSEPIRVNDEPEDLPIYQFHPWMVVNQEGVIIVFFYDQRSDPPNYVKFDSYIAFSFDGGETFTTNYRVSDVSSDPYDAYTNIQRDDSYQPPSSRSTTLRPMAGLLGEYIGVSAYYERVHCVWTDTRDGNQNVYYSNFTIPLLPPRIYYPDDDIHISDNPLDFRWAACGFFDEVNYDLEISTDSDFAAIDFTYPDIDTNFFTITPPSNETTYFWRIKAFKVTDTSQNVYSVTRSFMVDTTAPFVPLLISPPDSSVVSDSLPEFFWSEVMLLSKGATPAPVYYTLQTSEDSTFPAGPKLFEYTDIYAASFVVPDVLPDFKTYFWRVNASDEAGNNSGWQQHPFHFSMEVHICGDVDDDWDIDLSDVVYLANYYLKGGDPPPDPIARGNANGDEFINLSDVVYIANYYLKSGDDPHDCENYNR